MLPTRFAILCVAVLSIRQVMAAPKVDVQQVYPHRTADNQLRYEYRYSIDDAKSGVVSSTWEERRGEVVSGSYSLLEPGGRVRHVNYQVHPQGGFQAVVRTSLPGYELLSSQLYQRSLEQHPLVESELEQNSANSPHLEDSVKDYDPPINYHAINAAILGFQKLRSSQRSYRSLIRGKDNHLKKS